jgi:hypothetical protein
VVWERGKLNYCLVQQKSSVLSVNKPFTQDRLWNGLVSVASFWLVCNQTASRNPEKKNERVTNFLQSWGWTLWSPVAIGAD